MSVPCSESALGVGEPLAASAPHSLTWVAVEHDGPWGRDALTDSDLPDVTRRILLDLKAAGVGVVLIRRPGRREQTSGVEVLVARTAPGGAHLRRARVADLTDLEPLGRWDAQALAAGQLPAFGEASAEPVLLVCAHSRRDACCARLGRDLLAALDQVARPDERDRIWESSHLGGHRFAPVTLSLPTGVVQGRVGSVQARALLDGVADKRVLLDNMRGRTALPAPLQAAELAVRQEIGEDRVDVLDVLALANDRAVPVDAGWAVPMLPVDLEVRHEDGRTWRVTVQQETQAQRRPESCGKEAVPVHLWQTAPPVAGTPWRTS